MMNSILLCSLVGSLGTNLLQDCWFCDLRSFPFFSEIKQPFPSVQLILLTEASL